MDHTTAHIHNIAYVNCCTRTYFFPKQTALSREELVKELMKCSNIGDQVEIHPYWFHDAPGKYKLQSELLILKNCNSLLVNWIINPKKHIVQCSVHRNKNAGDKSCASFTKQCWPWGKSLWSPVFDWHKVKLEDVDACHRMKKKNKVIIKFNNWRQKTQLI